MRFGVNEATVAMPVASVTTVMRLDPPKVPDGPVVGAMNVTAAFGTTLPKASCTSTFRMPTAVAPIIVKTGGPPT